MKNKIELQIDNETTLWESTNKVKKEYVKILLLLSFDMKRKEISLIRLLKNVIGYKYQSLKFDLLQRVRISGQLLLNSLRNFKFWLNQWRHTNLASSNKKQRMFGLLIWCIYSFDDERVDVSQW